MKCSDTHKSCFVLKYLWTFTMGSDFWATLYIVVEVTWLHNAVSFYLYLYCRFLNGLFVQ